MVPATLDCLSAVIDLKMPRTSSHAAAMESRCVWWTKNDVALLRERPYLVASRASSSPASEQILEHAAAFVQLVYAHLLWRQLACDRWASASHRQ